jgi:hypothetical protein
MAVHSPVALIELHQGPIANNNRRPLRTAYLTADKNRANHDRGDKSTLRKIK